MTKHGERRRSAAGEGKIGCIFWVLLLAAGIYVGAKIIPISIAKGQLQDYIIELAQFERFKPPEFYVDAILQRALELDLPLEKKDIKVKAGGQRFIAEIDRRIPLDMIVTTLDWRFRIYIDRQVFIN